MRETTRERQKTRRERETTTEREREREISSELKRRVMTVSIEFVLSENRNGLSTSIFPFTSLSFSLPSLTIFNPLTFLLTFSPEEIERKEKEEMRRRVNGSKGVSESSFPSTILVEMVLRDMDRRRIVSLIMSPNSSRCDGW